jgi:hypothetical protein
MPGQYWPGYGQKILSKADFYTDFHLSVGPDEWIYESTGESSPAGYLAWWSDQGGFEMVKDTSKDYRDSTWHHAVLNKKTANEGDLWVDGVLLASSTTLAAVVNDADLIIGYTAHTDPLQQRYWSGKIDDIRIYNRVLSESEIVALFTESGQTDDQDGDGVTDGEDTCPDSDLSATVMVNGCDAGVANHIFPTGCTLSDLVALCADNAPRHNRHGKTFSCVARLTRTLQQVGVITSQQKGAIQQCATKKPKS